MTAYPGWRTFKEIDEELQQAKGTAFRQFKRAQTMLQQDVDYVVLAPDQHRAAIEILRSTGRIYASSINVVLLSPRACSILLDPTR